MLSEKGDGKFIKWKKDQKKIKQKKCRSCKTLFTPFSSTAFVCSIECAVTMAKANTAKIVKKDIKARKQALKSLGTLHKEAQPEFNKYIRLRDKGQPCISCQRHHTGQNHAGHFLSIGSSPELRYVENNVHLQCSVCNNHLSGNQLLYRVNLINKIGIKAVEELEGPQEPRRYRRDDIIAIKSKYKALVKELTVKLEGAA